MTPTEQFVPLARIPELQAILRAGLLSRVRIFEAVCERGHRLVQVVRINDHPLVLGTWTPGRLRGEPGPDSVWPPAHRARWDAWWLDRPGPIVTTVEGRYVRTADRHTFTCQDASEEIPMPWLREQVAAGRRRRAIDDAARREMGVLPTRLRGHRHRH